MPPLSANVVFVGGTHLWYTYFVVVCAAGFMCPRGRIRTCESAIINLKWIA